MDKDDTNAQEYGRQTVYVWVDWMLRGFIYEFQSGPHPATDDTDDLS